MTLILKFKNERFYSEECQDRLGRVCLLFVYSTSIFYSTSNSQKNHYSVQLVHRSTILLTHILELELVGPGDSKR